MMQPNQQIQNFMMQNQMQQ